MTLIQLGLQDFRLFGEVSFAPDPGGTTVITGPNGTGKTTLLEAVAYLGTQRSFRGAPRDVLVRAGADRAIVRAQLVRDELPVLVECEIGAQGRARTQVNRQLVRSRRGLADAAPTTVFSPEDLVVVQGGPGPRRELLDDALAVVDRQAATRIDEVERALRQRAALLRQAGGRLGPEVELSLEVWDDRLDAAGTALVEARESLLDALAPLVSRRYQRLAAAGRAGAEQRDHSVTMRYVRSWSGGLGEALRAARPDDVRRAVSTVGPHRDDLAIALDGRDTRHQASQGEQRSMAIALRLAVHELVTAVRGRPPILLLDDVFSELDPARSRALVELLPAGQALVTTASPLPPGVEVGAVVVAGEL
ncbi:MAG TPA: DNA replication and repair protein RecF [Acidimicrobiales bacterium]